MTEAPELREMDDPEGMAIHNATQMREMWKPSRLEQMAAVEILLASSIPTELREMVRRFEQQLTTRKDIQ